MAVKTEGGYVLSTYTSSSAGPLEARKLSDVQEGLNLSGILTIFILVTQRPALNIETWQTFCEPALDLLWGGPWIDIPEILN